MTRYGSAWIPRLAHNPHMILQNVSQERLEEAAKDEELKQILNIWLERRKWALEKQNWFEEMGYGSSIGT
jgi:hypothetical protein